MLAEYVEFIPARALDIDTDSVRNELAGREIPGKAG
jgi:hypothetical protein